MVAERYGMEAHEEIVESDMIHKIPAMIHQMDEPSEYKYRASCRFRCETSSAAPDRQAPPPARERFHSQQRRARGRQRWQWPLS